MIQIGKRAALLLLTLAFFAWPSCIFAQTDVKVACDRDTAMVTIEGKLDYPKKLVTVEVLRPLHSWAEIEHTPPSEILTVLHYFKQAQTDGDGYYKFQFQMSGETGTYPVRVFSEMDGAIFESEGFTYYSPETIKAALAGLNVCVTPAQMEVAVKESAEVLGLDTVSVGETQFPMFCEILLNLKDKSSGGAFQNVGELRDAAEEAKLLVSINACTASSELLKLVSEAAPQIGLDDSCAYDIFTNPSVYGPKKQLEALSDMNKEIYRSYQEFRVKFGKHVILRGCCQNSAWSAVDVILRTAKPMKAYDLSNYLARKDVSAVCKKLNSMASPYRDLSSLAAAANQPETPSGSTGGGGKTGGGGGGNIPAYEVEATSTSTPPPTPPVSRPFMDLDGYEWVREAADALYDADIIQGDGNGRFHPEQEITREAFVKMLVLALKLPESENAMSFTDVEAGAWYETYIKAAVGAKIVNGMENGTFGVGSFISRQDAVAIAYRALTQFGLQEAPNTEELFADHAEIADYAKAPAYTLVREKILQGVGDSRFAPADSIDRASAAKLIYEIMNWRERHA